MMKVVYVSNFLNHHSLPLCEEFIRNADDFTFITTDMHYSQGYQQPVEKPYVVFSEKEPERAKRLIFDADMVIFGACPASMMEERMSANKLSFLYTERYFKRGTWRRFIPSTRRSIERRVGRYRGKDLFVLCASAFLPYDLSFFGYPIEKCLKGGYFPECKGVECEKTPRSILWAGRMLDWKHPEVPVEVAKKLRSEGIDFTMTIVGEGPEEGRVRALIEKYALSGCVKMAGSASHEKLMDMMAEHEIFMFTSDRNEGWGAVLNEAMTNGCAVVASSAIGSVPYLIDNGENGRIYRDGRTAEAYDVVKELLLNRELARQYGVAARESMKNYDYRTFVKRIMELSVHFLQAGEILRYDSGVLSPAELIKDNWFKERK